MCTVTYLPSRDGFTLTHNRDEAPSRSLFHIDFSVNQLGLRLIFPRDARAGGTWIATAENGKTACLLNGAFVRHHHQPPYRRSRGLMMLDFFNTKRADDFYEGYDLEGIEPFTFLYFHDKQVVEFRWDGAQRYYKPLSGDASHFWCSSTLYPAEMQQVREQVFRRWLTEKHALRQPSPRELVHLHLTGSVGDPENDFVMNRGGRVQTVSVTQVVAGKKFSRMRYLDLLGGNRDERFVLLKDR